MCVAGLHAPVILNKSLEEVHEGIKEIDPAQDFWDFANQVSIICKN